MKFLHPEHDSRLELSTRDIFLLPAYFDGASRQEVDLCPQDFLGSSQPIVAANMNAVCGKRMAEVMARYGGLGVLPQDMEIETALRIVKSVKDAPIDSASPLWVRADDHVRHVLGLIKKRDHNLVLVLDDSDRPVGTITAGDLKRCDPYENVARVMNRDALFLDEKLSPRESFEKLETARVHAAPVLKDDGRLIGVRTKADCVRFSMQAASQDNSGKLMVAAAVGISKEAVSRAVKLVEGGVDVLVLDTAHGHQRRMLDALRAVKSELGDRVPLVAGNVCTGEGSRALIEAGADVVKVNVGPGAMCTTRMQTGAGRPTFSSVQACAAEARKLGKHAWADGGIRHPRDAALYLAAGASRVMVGSMLAGCYESPGELREDADGRFYKENFGMASARAVRDRNEEVHAFDRAKQGLFREGISTSKIYLKDGLEGAGDIVFNMVTGLRSSLTYVGARSLNEFYEKAVVGVQTASGYSEGTPHGALW